MRRLDGRILPIACLMYPFTREFPITVLLCQYLHALYLSIEGSPARSVSGYLSWRSNRRSTRAGAVGVLLFLRASKLSRACCPSIEHVE